MEIPRYEEFHSWTLSEYLALLWPERSQRGIAELFARGRVRSQGRPVGLERVVGEASGLELVGALDDCASIHLGEAEPAGLELLHEDARLVVLSKPSGIAVVPDRGSNTQSVLGWLIRRELAERATTPPGAWVRYRIVHRTDRLTSGLLLVARTPEFERLVGAAFEERRVKKSYLAIVAGVVRPARFTVHCPVVPGRKGKMRAELKVAGETQPALDALTEFDVLERFRAHTLLCARPLTGRTHQIRVHAWAAGHPLAIDPVYGPRPGTTAPPDGIDRLTLHAQSYELPPELGEPRVFSCPPPADFVRALDSLRACTIEKSS